ncbi:MAG: ABC transporter permease [Bacteroidaceae bacterium]|nr:ABC transporter permease [Bacteroidaceae bacterium]
MRIDRDNIEEILITITRNKTRSALTAFGVFWGIFMLVFMLGGGHGMKNMLMNELSGVANNSGFVFSDRTTVPYKGFRKGRRWDMEMKDLEALQRIQELEVVAANNSRWGKTIIYEEKKYNDGTLRGLTPSFEKIEDQHIKYGRFINDVDIREERKVCVLGKEVYQRLFEDGEDPCGHYVQVDGVYYMVIGLSMTDGNFNINGYPPESIVIPISTMQRLYNYGNRLELIAFTMKPGAYVKDVEPRIRQIIRERHLIAPDDNQAVQTINAETLFKMVDDLMGGIEVLIWMVGLGTLLAGAIGVINIMMVTVKERTTEIGIRRAIGAKPIDILQQIISESMVLTLVSGMGGICFGVGLLDLLEKATGETNLQVSFWLAIGTCFILLLLSILAGLAPAYRAMAIKPIDAIRDE